MNTNDEQGPNSEKLTHSENSEDPPKPNEFNGNPIENPPSSSATLPSKSRTNKSRNSIDKPNSFIKSSLKLNERRTSNQSHISVKSIQNQVHNKKSSNQNKPKSSTSFKNFAVKLNASSLDNQNLPSKSSTIVQKPSWVKPSALSSLAPILIPNHIYHSPLRSNPSVSSRVTPSTIGIGVPKDRVEKAIQEGKIFEIRGRVNPAVRETLLKRGWIEKPPRVIPKPTSKSSVVLKSPSRKLGYEPKRGSKMYLVDTLTAARRMLIEHPANLIWSDLNDRIAWKTALVTQKINRHPQAEYASKKNLFTPVQNLQWTGTESGVSVNSHIRSYRLYNDEEKRAFIQDYRLTACMSLLKWYLIYVEKNWAKFHLKSKSVLKIYSDLDSVSDRPIFKLVDFALSHVNHYVRKRKHKDIDDDLINKMNNNSREQSESNIKGRKKDGVDTSPSQKSFHSSTLDWGSFLQQFYSMTRSPSSLELNFYFKGNSTEELKVKVKVHEKYNQVKSALQNVQLFWPQFYIDGLRNVWIFKPSTGSMGNGIVVLDKYEDIAPKFIFPNTRNTNWISQKYIERPLLIFKAKFDIRQWFLVTNFNPLVAWMYKKSYLRFSTKVFSLDDLHESVHLTNNSVQTKYLVDPNRGNILPSDNMWSSDYFQAYLAKIGKPNVWKEIIYPGMKKALCGVLHGTRENLTDHPGTFHIQGADFLVTEDFQPWLIEINSRPVFANTTSVTSILCPQCIRDTLKVVLDWNLKTNPQADVGDYELLCPIKSEIPPPAVNDDQLTEIQQNEFTIQGKPLPVLQAENSNLMEISSRKDVDAIPEQIIDIL